MADLIVNVGRKRVYDPDENRTRVWDKGGFRGYEPGNTEKLGQLPGPIDSGVYATDPPITRLPDGSVDWGKTTRDWLSNIVPAAVTVAAPEIKPLAGALSQMSPIQAVLTKMGLGTVAGTAADQLINAGHNKPLLNSAVDSGLNSALGIGVPELFPKFGNVKFETTGITRTSTNNRGPSVTERSSTGTTNRSSSSTTDRSSIGTNKRSSSGTSTTNSTSSSLGFNPFDEVTITRDPDTGKFITPRQVKVPREGEYQTNNQSSSTTASSGTGQSNYRGSGTSESVGSGSSNYESSGTSTTTPGTSVTTREAGYPGVIGHIWDLIRSVQTVPRTRANGAPMLTPLQSALSGLGLNSLFDYEGNKQ